jgi:3-oxoadipate enol-lactonase
MTPVDVHAAIDGPADAPVVVLSPSLGATLGMWDPQVDALAQRFRVVRYDPRGHGRSPVPAGPYEIADLAEDVVRLLDRHDIARAHYCGLSLGGMTGIALAADHPDRVERLVLCSTTAQFPSPEPWVERAATVRAEGTAAVAGSVVGRWLTADFAATHPEIVTRLRTMIEQTPDEGYAACCGAIERMDLRAALARIAAPTLVVSGEQDQATPPEFLRRIADAIPGSRLKLLSPAAHLANIEQADTVTQLLLEHLAPTG